MAVFISTRGTTETRRGDSGEKRRQDGADDADRQRKLGDRAPLLLDDHAADVPLVHELLHRVDELIRRDLERFLASSLSHVCPPATRLRSFDSPASSGKPATGNQQIRNLLIPRSMLDRANDVGRVLRRGCETRVLEAIDADRKRTADFLGTCACATTGLPCLCASSTTARTSSIVISS